MIGKIARHLAGAAAAWLVFVVQGVVAYVGQLAYAVVADADTGGPLAGPLLVLLAGGVGVALVPLLFVPAGLVSEVATKSGRLLPKLLIAFAVAAALATIYITVVAVATDVPIIGALSACLGGVVAVLGPTAVHVGVSHGTLSIGSIWRRFRPAAPGVRI
ncbi:hypothetical protein [Micromonospora sp. NPDC093277]|uniref:hypothetical protein n=1 Tax=Micromonospora sp. NPDC093277 TaxID=3364291 RepID=UPI0038226DEB